MGNVVCSVGEGGIVQEPLDRMAECVVPVPRRSPSATRQPDLGFVTDSTLNATTIADFFSESWEAVIPKVIESLKITSTFCTHRRRLERVLHSELTLAVGRAVGP